MKRDFLAITDFSRSEIDALFDLAADLKKKQKKGKTHHILSGQTLAMIFQKPSLRTRFSFETAMFQLGGHAIYLSPDEVGLGKRETPADVARVLSRFADGIMARVFSHDLLVEMARHAGVRVINGLSDLLHPCQILGDMLTILEHRRTFDNLKVAFIGDGNNVAHSWINMASRIPFHFALACPKGYDPNPEIVDRAKSANVGKITIHRDPVEAASGADVLYTDVWASMGQEQEAVKRKKAFKGFQINRALMDRASKDVLIMHCLPAHRGEEITDEAIESPRSIVFDEAENRLHIQKAILATLMSR
jgi:ornithine carbamoyltransferase